MTEHDSSGSLLLSAPEGPGCISFVSLHASNGSNQRERNSQLIVSAKENRRRKGHL